MHGAWSSHFPAAMPMSQVPVREKVRKALGPDRPEQLFRNIGQRRISRAPKRREISKFLCWTSSLVEYREYGFVIAYFVVRILKYLQAQRINMGKLNVSMLRYLSSEEFRVLTAVSEKFSSLRVVWHPARGL